MAGITWIKITLGEKHGLWWRCDIDMDKSCCSVKKLQDLFL